MYNTYPSVLSYEQECSLNYPSEVYAPGRGHMDQSETAQETVAVSEPTPAPSKAKTQKPSVTSTDKKADAAQAKKKKKRDAHRVALRRSHTNG